MNEAELRAFALKAARHIIDTQWVYDSDCGGVGQCRECRVSDYEDHQKGCDIGKLVKESEALLKEVE